MANNFNPVTGRKTDPAKALEVPGGNIYFDDEDGLLWGDTQLPGGVDADKMFLQLHGKERPDTYKEYLAKINGKVDENGKVNGLEADTASDVLDEQSPSQVLITNTMVVDYAALAGFEGAISHGAIEGDGYKPTVQGRLDSGVHLSSLGKGAAKPEAPPEQSDTSETLTARAAADKADADRKAQADTDAQTARDKQTADDKVAADIKAAQDAKVKADAAKVDAAKTAAGTQGA